MSSRVFIKRFLAQRRKGAKEDAKKALTLCVFLCVFAPLQETFISFQTIAGSPLSAAAPARSRCFWTSGDAEHTRGNSVRVPTQPPPSSAGIQSNPRARKRARDGRPFRTQRYFDSRAGLHRTSAQTSH